MVAATTAAIGSPSMRTVGRLGAWLSVRHSLRIEAAGALTLYGLYELARGLVGADTAEADGHARHGAWPFHHGADDGEFSRPRLSTHR